MRRKTIFTALSFLLTLGLSGCSQEKVQYFITAISNK